VPIRPDLREHYRVHWRKVVRPRILERAKHRCEQCGAPDRYLTLRGPAGTWRLLLGCDWHTAIGGNLTSEPEGRKRTVRIVLTVAHLNHVAGDDRDENLKALCQWCHLHYDAMHHAETRATRKDRARPLLGVA
jgi:hypothetical protein